MSYVLRVIYYSLLISLCAPASSFSSTTPKPDTPLNSERIAQKFGNYGLELISQNPSLRISNLYSEADGVRTTRTIAVVNFLNDSEEAIVDLHQLVLSGHSIGATFKAHGWQINKKNYDFKSIYIKELKEKYNNLLKVESNQILAVHLYLLQLSHAGTETIDYALIAELHHPDYLTLAELEVIYGSATDTGQQYSKDAERIFNALLKEPLNKPE